MRCGELPAGRFHRQRAFSSGAGKYSVNRQTVINPFLMRIVPPVAAIVLIVTFTSLGRWQLERAAEKEALAAMFAEDAPYRDIRGVSELTPFEKIEARGRLRDDRQILIDNIVRNGRLGYFVITPLEIAGDEALLLINRGWMEKPNSAGPAGDVSVADDRRRLRGRAGHLPRVGIRSGDAFAGSDGQPQDRWPRTALYPTIEEVAVQLGS